MRVVGGTFRGMKLVPFEGMDIRPTADRVKESIFDILASEIAGCRALDLFCGSGALGIECLSRGAEHVSFNDNSPRSIAVLTRNLQKLKGAANYDVTRLDFAERLKRERGKFDLVFIDPPYAHDSGIQALKIIGAGNILSKDGVCVFERNRRFDGEIEGLRISDERKYGTVCLTFFKRPEAEN